MPKRISRIVTKVKFSNDGKFILFPINPDIKEKDDPTGLNQFPMGVAKGCLIKPDALIWVYTPNGSDKFIRSLSPEIIGILGLSRTCEICPRNYEGRRRETERCLTVYHKEKR